MDTNEEVVFREFVTAVNSIVEELSRLGNGNACTNGMGAIEGHAMHLGEKIEGMGHQIGGGLENVAHALHEVAQALLTKE